MTGSLGDRSGKSYRRPSGHGSTLSSVLGFDLRASRTEKFPTRVLKLVPSQRCFSFKGSIMHKDLISSVHGKIPHQHLSEKPPLGLHSGGYLLMAAKAELKYLNKSKYHISDKCWFGQTYAPLRWNFLGPEPLFLRSKIEKEWRARPRSEAVNSTLGNSPAVLSNDHQVSPIRKKRRKHGLNQFRP